MLAFICAFGALQLLLVASAFAFVSTPSRRWFAAFAAAVSVVIGGSAVMESPLIAAWPHAGRVHVPFMYLLAPLLHLWVRASLGEDRPRRAWLHALPAIACALLLVPFYLSPAEAKLAALAHRDVWVTVRLLVLLAQGAVYLPPTIALLIRRQSRDRFLWASTAVVTLLLIAGLGRVGGHVPPLWIPSAFALAAMAMVAQLLHAHIAPRAKYARSTLTAERADDYLRKLDEHVAREKPYLDPELTLERLAEALSVAPGHLSQLINQRLGSGFNEWVNAQRVEEVKRRLLDRRHAHLSIAAIGEACGFRSKSTFNAAFRKQTGETPCGFRRGRPES